MKANFDGVVRTQTDGLELISRGEKEPDERACRKLSAMDPAPRAVIAHGKLCEGQRHAGRG